ncbi:MAG: hypothetical protein K2Q18_13320, partial [Bdellovibrionales bacterium]|nr:hypothetical protein [Bdellovibrionales bacterium]
MKSTLGKYIFLFLCMTIFSFVQAAQTNVQKPVVQKVSLKGVNGELFKVSLISYKNHNEELEVRIEATGLPRMASHINPLLGFGRDTDQNGKVDTWFFMTKNGIDTTVEEGKNALGDDILGRLLVKKYRSTFSMYVTSATTSLLSYLLFSASVSGDV